MEQSEKKYSLPQPPPEAHYTVYMLKDPEGKIYIGCTGKSVENRWKKGWHYNYRSHISKAIRSIGWDHFEKRILCEKLTREGAEKLEKWFIAYYDSANPEKGYNRELGGLGKGVRVGEATKKSVSEAISRKYEEDPGYAVRLSEGGKRYFREHPEKKEIIRQRMKDYLSKPENRTFVEADRRPKPVLCVETGVIYPSQKAAEKATGFTGFHKVCGGRRNMSGGFHWRYAEI